MVSETASMEHISQPKTPKDVETVAKDIYEYINSILRKEYNYLKFQTKQ